MPALMYYFETRNTLGATSRASPPFTLLHSISDCASENGGLNNTEGKVGLPVYAAVPNLFSTECIVLFAPALEGIPACEESTSRALFDRFLKKSISRRICYRISESVHCTLCLVMNQIA